MSSKITGLTANNVSALREVLGDSSEIHALTATTATFKITPALAVAMLNEIIASLPGRGHPRASLYAVVRKLQVAESIEAAQDGRAYLEALLQL